VGGKFHLKISIDSRPIGNKYHEGEVERTLKRELKVPEIAEREAYGTSATWCDCCVLGRWLVASAQASFRVLRLMCAVFHTLCVSVGSGLRKTALGR